MSAYKNIYETAEEIEVSFSVADTSLYRLPFGRLFTSYEIWTGAGKTGTQLTENVDFIVGGESARAGEVKGESVYSGFQITNSGYHSTTLYATILFVGTIVDESSKNLVNVVSKSADYTISEYTDEAIEVTTGASDVTITLPDLALWKGRKIWIYKVDDGAGQVIIEPAGSDKITKADLTEITLTSQGDRWGLEALSVWWDLFEGYESGQGTDVWIKTYTGELVQRGYRTVSTTSPLSNFFGTTSGTSYAGTQTITFPLTFYGGAPVITVGVDTNADSIGAVRVQEVAAASFILVPFNRVPTTSSAWWRAEGRWY